MNEQPLLSDEQSAELAGVSVDTIEKYCQIGLLVPEMRGDKPFFKEADIKSLFYTKSNYSSFAATTAVETPQEHPTSPAPQQSSQEETIESSELPTAEEAESQVLETPTQERRELEPSQREAQLLEMNQTLREQIELLREERDWLRQRIEHLETRSEREQMLLLAESETVRRLVKTESLTEKLLNFRLPWFSNPNQNPSNKL